MSLASSHFMYILESDIDEIFGRNIPASSLDSALRELMNPATSGNVYRFNCQFLFYGYWIDVDCVIERERLQVIDLLCCDFNISVNEELVATVHNWYEIGNVIVSRHIPLIHVKEKWLSGKALTSAYLYAHMLAHRLVEWNFTDISN